MHFEISPSYISRAITGGVFGLIIFTCLAVFLVGRYGKCSSDENYNGTSSATSTSTDGAFRGGCGGADGGFGGADGGGGC